MDNSDYRSHDLAMFLKQALRTIAKIVVDISHAAQSLSEMLERIRENNQWWQQGVGPDIDGVYPERIFSQRWDNDDPPPYDLSA